MRIDRKGVELMVVLLLVLPFSAQAGQVDTVRIYSAAMQREIPAVIMTPDSYARDTARYPTVYLLHGYSGDYQTWYRKAPELLALVDQHQAIIVCPDGGYNSWYLDSPLQDSSQYETHVAQEIIAFVDTTYRTIAERTGRAITGLSMGGHGALFLALRHPDTFGAAGSMSGGVDLTYDTDAWEISEKLGPYEEHLLRWDSLSVVNLVALQPPDSLTMIIDCGTDDFFFAINQQLHRTLLKQTIAHDYIVRPGRHQWEYWNEAVLYQLLFFAEYFDQQSSKPVNH